MSETSKTIPCMPVPTSHVSATALVRVEIARAKQFDTEMRRLARAFRQEILHNGYTERADALSNQMCELEESS